MARITVFKTPNSKQVASRGFRIKAEDAAPRGIPMVAPNKKGKLTAFRKLKTTENKIIRKTNPANPNGGFDVSSVQYKKKEKLRRNGTLVLKEKSRIDRNYNNPKTSSTQKSKTKLVTRNGREIKAKFK